MAALIIELVVDRGLTRSWTVILQQHVIFKVPVFLVARLTARKIFAMQAFESIALDRGAIANVAVPRMRLQSR